jgi:flagellar motor switch protein FliM
MLVDILFGGSGRDTFKVEGREFTAIENNIIRRVVLNALADLEKAWRGLIELKMEYQRSEVNPQFVYIVSPTDVVVAVNFEIEVEYSSGLITLCIPYATLEPLREKLQAGFQSEQMEVDKRLLQAEVDLVVELGNTQISAGDVADFQIGDVIPLEQYAADPVRIFVEGVLKYDGYAGVYRGSQAVQIARTIGQEGE